MNDELKNEIQKSNHAQRFIADAVCPRCYRAIESPTIMQQSTECGLEIRQYFGYCRNCSAGFVVIQFSREDRWIIHKYRPAVVLGIDNVVNVEDNWKIMSDMPEPEGGNCGDVMGALREMHAAMKSCCVTIECLIKDMTQKRGKQIDDAGK